MRLTQWGQSFYEFGFEFLYINNFMRYYFAGNALARVQQMHEPVDL